MVRAQNAFKLEGMTPREEYETYVEERRAMAIEIRCKLIDCFEDQAARAVKEHRWEAAAAFQYCASIALGYVTKIESK